MKTGVSFLRIMCEKLIATQSRNYVKSAIFFTKVEE